MMASSEELLALEGSCTSTSSSDPSSSLSEDKDEVELESEFDDIEDDSASTDRESLDFLRLFFLEVRFLRFFLVVFFCLTFRPADFWGLGEGVLAALGEAFSGSLLGDIMLAVAAVILLGR